MTVAVNLGHRLQGEGATEIRPGLRRWIYRAERMVVVRWEHDTIPEDQELAEYGGHEHQLLEQTTFVIEGACEAHVGASVAVVTAGGIFRSPPGAHHFIRRVDRARLVLLDVFSPAEGDFTSDFPAQAVNAAEWACG